MTDTIVIQEVEKEFRAAQMSISAICAKFKVTRPQLNEWVATYGWTRNLGETVRDATQEEVLRRTAGPDTTEGHGDIIEKAAGRTADVVMGHRSDIQALRAISAKLRARVIAQIADEGADWVPEDIIAIHPYDSLLRGKTQGTVDVFMKLVEVQFKLIQLERQAYGLDDSSAPMNEDAIRSIMDAAQQELKRRGTFVAATGRPSRGTREDSEGPGGFGRH